MQDVPGQQRARQVVGGIEVAFPGPGGRGVEVAAVGGRGKVRDAGGGDGVDGLGDDPVLERRLVEEADVVDDDGAPSLRRIGQVEDVLRETRPRDNGGEAQPRAGRQIVQDFEHRRAFVAAARLAGQNFHAGRQVAGRLPRGERVHAVGESAQFLAVAGVAQVRPDQRGLVREVALRRRGLVGRELALRRDEADVRRRRERLEFQRMHPRAHRAEARRCKQDFGARQLERRQRLPDPRAVEQVDVHGEQVIGVGQRALQRQEFRKARCNARGVDRQQQAGVDLPLRRGPRFLLCGECLQLVARDGTDPRQIAVLRGGGRDEQQGQDKCGQGPAGAALDHCVMRRNRKVTWAAMGKRGMLP
ncbi:MAG: hypothetical protein IPI73_19640 [Betaproteobacteria bacterium]|nr:hypothetical protein [Betaproteobacteria bacterium]